VAIFVEDASDELAADEFQPFMDSYCENTPGAGSEAHAVDGDAVSVNDDVNNMGSYISEYLGIFGEEALDRPLSEQMFFATCWATTTRRLDFGQQSQQIISGEEFRRETGLRPSDRGECESDSKPAHADESDEDDGDNSGWSVERLCTVPSRTREHVDGEAGGVDVTTIDGRGGGVDPPKWVE
jgi:hypothetical protein